jgi:hypothetical protein
MEQQQCPRCHFTLPQQARICRWCGLSLAEAAPVRPLTVPIASTASLASGASGQTIFALETLLAQAQASSVEDAGPANSLGSAIQPPPPPTSHRSARRLSRSLDLWWIWVILAVGAITWALARDAQFTSDALAIAGRLCLAGAIAIGVLGLGMRAARRSRHGLSVPIVVAMALGLIGLTALGLSTRVDVWQAAQAEQQGDFARAIALLHHDGDSAGIVQAHIDWARALATRGDYAGAQDQADQALSQAKVTAHAQALAELGTVLWQWGASLQQSGDIQGALAKWQAAAQQAGATPDGSRALAALHAPQAVHGVMLWQGQPARHVQVSLVSQWSYDGKTLLTSGQRLTGTTDDTGAFTITGAVPGTIYALLWRGADGDTTVLTALGTPIYTITIAPLVGGDFGTISIGAA